MTRLDAAGLVDRAGRGRLLSLAALGALLVGLIIAGASLHVPGADSVGTPLRVDLFIGILGAAGCAYLSACWLVCRGRLPHGALAVALAVAMLMRVVALAEPPFLSSDLYRYVWDGRVQLAGINPYRYIPADPALRGLRDLTIYPHVNRRDYAPTAYPPMAQLIFLAIAALWQSAFAIKLAMVAFEAVAMAAMAALLRQAGLPRARLLIYAWNPLAVWTYAGNGHVDAAAIGLLGLALMASGQRRGGWAGAALGGAILVKFLPIAVAPALWRRWDWRFPLALSGVVAGLYGLYAGVGWRVLGFLSGYAAEEHVEGSGVWLIAGLSKYVTPLSPQLVLVTVAGLGVGLVTLGLWVALRRRRSMDGATGIVRMGRDAAILAACLMLVASPHYPWYYPWLALPCCLYPLRSVIWLSIGALLLYLDPLADHFAWSSLVYGPALLLAAVDVARHRADALGDEDRCPR